jgi:hypothetical protein
VDTYTQELAKVDRAILDGETEGFVRVHVRKRTDEICHTGATQTTSEWLLFLHADTLLPLEAESVFRTFAAKPAAQIGTFRVQFADGGRFVNALAWAASRGDSVFTRFGDQGILVRRSFYAALGGFPPWPLFEDVALFQKARKLSRVYWLPGYVFTSARAVSIGAACSGSGCSMPG